MKPTSFLRNSFLAAALVALAAPVAFAADEVSSTTVTPGTPTVIEKNNTVTAPPVVIEKKVPVPVVIEKKTPPVIIEKTAPAPVLEEKTTTTTTTTK